MLPRELAMIHNRAKTDRHCKRLCLRAVWDCSNNAFGRTLVTLFAGMHVVQVYGTKEDEFCNFKGDDGLGLLGILDGSISINRYRC